MINIIEFYPWDISRKIIDYCYNPILCELRSMYTIYKLNKVRSLRDINEHKYANYILDAFRLAGAFNIYNNNILDWNQCDYYLYAVYNWGSEVYANWKDTNDRKRQAKSWLTQVNNMKLKKYGHTPPVHIDKVCNTYSFIYF